MARQNRAPLDMGSSKITSVTDPTSAQDAATKNYVDNLHVATFSNADYTMTSTDRLIEQIGSLTAERYVTLVAANSLTAGTRVRIFDRSATVDATGATQKGVTILPADAAAGPTDTINNTLCERLMMARGWVELETDGSANWTTVGGSGDRIILTASGAVIITVPNTGRRAISMLLGGAGGGGGGGSRGATSTNRPGGGGGASGNCSKLELGLGQLAATSTTVTASSNGVNANTFTGSGTLNVTDTTFFPSAGFVTIFAGARIRYTGKTATTFTGCTSTDNFVLATNHVVLGLGIMLTCTVGAKGTAGPAATADTTSGSNGGAGGDTTIKDGTRTFTASGGLGGLGGVLLSASNAGGGIGAKGMYAGQVGGQGVTSGTPGGGDTVGTSTTGPVMYLSGAGGGGCGRDSSNASGTPGGQGGSSANWLGNVAGGTGATAAAGVGAAAADLSIAGSGGGGGATTAGNVGRVGGNGAGQCSGGGGGGASLNGNAAAAGGTGADGVIELILYR